MPFYRRRLPHLYETNQPVFVTWRLYGSLPPSRCFPPATADSGKAFTALDKLLDEARAGPFYLRQPDIAQMIVEALYHAENVLESYIEANPVRAGLAQHPSDYRWSSASVVGRIS